MNIKLPPVIFGSSALGNLYEIVPDDNKKTIVQNWMKYQPDLTVIDSAGKYGAGLALESIGKFLKELNADPNKVLISNKLGWKRIPLATEQPEFEKDVWFGLKHDAEQRMGYDGILECWEQGNKLLGAYSADLLSVHDPDEYLNSASSKEDYASRYNDIKEAYRALEDLRNAGKCKAIGVGSKDWRIIKQLHSDGIRLDWVMFANSYTLYSHPHDVFTFMAALEKAGVTIINSAVFNAGFLIGGKYFNYVEINESSHPELFEWRSKFLRICSDFSIHPAHACCQFGISPSGVSSIALNTSHYERVKDNVQYATEGLPEDFWEALKENNLIEKNYPFA